MPSGKLTNMSLWSTTAASNATVGSITWAEGQAPSTVNDSSRQEMADLRSWYETAQWIDYGYSISFVSTTVFKFHDANRTSLAEVNRRIRAGVGAGTIYGTVTDTTFSTSDTQVTVTWDSGQLDSSLSYVALGILSPTQGALVPFPDTMPIVVGGTDRTKKVRFEVDGLTTGTTRVITIPDTNTTLTTPGWVFITSVTASASAQLDITSGIDNTYDSYALVAVDILPATNNVNFLLRASTDGGSSFDSGANYGVYANAFNGTRTGDAQTSIELANAITNTAATGGLTGVYILGAPAGSKYKKITINSSYIGWSGAADTTGMQNGGGVYRNGTAVNALRFLMSSGNITSGVIYFYGVRKA